jgi:ATP-dependent RNA helicase DDX60
MSKTFKELSHWHNHRPLDQKAKIKLTPQQALRFQRRNQFFMAEMRDYAASLSSSVGGILEPETVFVAPTNNQQHKTYISAIMTDVSTGPNFTKGLQKPGKKAHSKVGKPSVKDMAASISQQKEMGIMHKQMRKWVYKRESFDKESNLVIRFTKVKEYMFSLSKDSHNVLEAEISTYLLDTLIQMLIANSNYRQEHKAMSIAVLIWETISRITKAKQGVSFDIASYVENIIKLLGLPNVSLHVQSQKKLSFNVLLSDPKWLI